MENYAEYHHLICIQTRADEVLDESKYKWRNIDSIKHGKIFENCETQTLINIAQGILIFTKKNDYIFILILN